MKKIINLIKWKTWLWRSKTKYQLWDRWRYGDLLSRPIGESEKVHFTLSGEEGMPGGESMWAKKVSRDTYELKNNGFYAHVAAGDIVRVKAEWPHLEVVDVIERHRRTARIFFELPWPDRETRSKLVEELRKKNYEIEWGYPNLLSVSVPLDHDPYETIAPLLGKNARIFEVD